DNIAHLAENKNFKFTRHDVTERFVVAGPVDYVWNFASPASPIDYLELPIETLKAGALGTRQTSLSGLPKVSVDVDGSTVALDLSISVRWPASVPAVTRAVRDRVRRRVRALTGMTVLDVDISVTDLATRLAKPARVR
ncbi:MAG: Asp23/Gls24 family envelope stress response protein, partial [Streptosporangiaceae bacterium]